MALLHPRLQPSAGSTLALLRGVPLVVGAGDCPMTCCGIRLTTGRHCAYCRTTIRLIRERRCVACRLPVTDSDREEGLCAECRSRRVRVSRQTARLLILAAKARHASRTRVAA